LNIRICRDERADPPSRNIPTVSQIITDQRDNGVATMLAIIATVFTAGYMLPWVVAAARGKANHWTVFWVNLLLGWTIVGWVIAIIMAMGPHRVLRVYR